MNERLLEIDSVSKEYRLGQLNGRTLQADLTSWFARIRGKEDPNTKVGAERIQNGTLRALDKVSLNVDRGDALAITGRNGAGKSTLLKLISRITLPSEGEIRIHGRVASLLEIGTGFNPELTGRDNIYLNGAILGMNRAETSSKLKQIIEFSEIAPFIDTPVKRYSSGMYVKLAFAVAAHLDPDVMICDEVLAVGDLNFQQKCLSKMRDIAREGRAVLYVSHNMRTVAELCNRGIYLEGGKLLYDGTTERAIELYGGSGARGMDINLDDMPRTKNRGDTMRLLRMRVLNAENQEYEMDSHMDFELEGIANVPENRLRVRVTLINGMATPLSMAQTDAFEVAAGEKFNVKIRMPLDSLAPGEYGVKISLVGPTPTGATMTYDTVNDADRFAIIEDPSYNAGYKWLTRYWGNVRLKPLEFI